jgi:hypothetical protein
MGWLNILGDIGLGVAAPFTGGASLAAIPAVNALGATLGKQQQGQAQGQLSQGQLQQGQDRNAVDLYQAQQNAQNQAAQTDLARQQFTSQNRGTTAKQALLASLLGGDYKGANVSVPGIQNATISGGLLDSLKNSPGALAAMKGLGSQASQAQNTPLTFQGGQMITAPSLTPLPQESKTNSVLDTIARIGQLVGAAGGAIPQKAPVVKPPSLPVTSGWAGSGFGGG